MSELESRLAAEDPDRWLSSRFAADAAARADLALLYLIDNELAAVRGKARDALVAEMRLAWWRDALDGMMAGRGGRGHPLLEALTASGLPLGPVAGLPDRYIDALDPAEDDEAVLARIDETDGVVMGIAALRLDPDARVEQVADAARAWRLGRSGQADAAAVRDLLSRGRGALSALPPAAFAAVAHATLARAYAAGHEPGALGKRLRITLAVMTGRL